MRRSGAFGAAASSRGEAYRWTSREGSGSGATSSAWSFTFQVGGNTHTKKSIQIKIKTRIKGNQIHAAVFIPDSCSVRQFVQKCKTTINPRRGDHSGIRMTKARRQTGDSGAAQSWSPGVSPNPPEVQLSPAGVRVQGGDRFDFAPAVRRVRARVREVI